MEFQIDGPMNRMQNKNNHYLTAIQYTRLSPGNSKFEDFSKFLKKRFINFQVGKSSHSFKEFQVAFDHCRVFEKCLKRLSSYFLEY